MVANGDVMAVKLYVCCLLLWRFHAHSLRRTWRWRGGTSWRQFAQRLRPPASKAFYITAVFPGQLHGSAPKLPVLVLALTFTIFLSGRRSEPRTMITILLIFFTLTSSVTLNLFSKATNFCLKLGCWNRKDTQVNFFLHTQVRKGKGWGCGDGEGTVAIKFVWQLGSSLSRLAATLPLDYSFIAALHKDH